MKNNNDNRRIKLIKSDNQKERINKKKKRGNLLFSIYDASIFNRERNELNYLQKMLYKNIFKVEEF